MTYEDALDTAINVLRTEGFDEEAEILDTCNCKNDFSDGLPYCQECHRKVRRDG